jgi:hypothetical protein
MVGLAVILLDVLLLEAVAEQVELDQQGQLLLLQFKQLLEERHNFGHILAFIMQAVVALAPKAAQRNLAGMVEIHHLLPLKAVAEMVALVLVAHLVVDVQLQEQVVVVVVVCIMVRWVAQELRVLLL